MAISGVISLILKLRDFREMYFDSRLNIYKQSFPEYKKDPSKVDASLRSELKSFLNKLEELCSEIEDQPIFTDELYKELKNVNPILSEWLGRGVKAIPEWIDFEETQSMDDDGLIFKMDMGH